LFDISKAEALKNGALGFGISGSGPSMFALSKGRKTAQIVEKTLVEVYKNSEIEIDSHVSKVSLIGSKIIG
jgi:homoserine kinase